MRKSCLVLAALVVGLSPAAMAKEVKQQKPVTPAQMSNTDLDKITAGFSSNNNGLNGAGIGASGNGKGQGAANNNGHGRY